MMQIYEKNEQNASKFYAFEKKEREYIMKIARSYSNFLAIKEVSPEGSFCGWDAIMLSAGTQNLLLTEVKVRDFSIHKYPDAILETKKVDKLIEINENVRPLMNENGWYIHPYYIAVYPSSHRAAIWQITGNEKEIEMEMNEKTAISTTKKVTKKVKLFKMDDAEIIQF